MAEETDRARLRTRIVEVAAARLAEDGPAAVTTRGVAEAAGVQAPTIYRLFGDKDGLLEAVAEHVMARHAAAKAEAVGLADATGADPVDDLRSSWLQQIEFGLANPAVFRLLSDPARVTRSPAAAQGRRVLAIRVHRVAEAGRLAVAEARAVDLIQASGVGTIQALLAAEPAQRDPALPGAMLDAVLARILVDPPVGPDARPTAVAVAFRALVPALEPLSAPERALMLEWVDRVLAAAR